MCLRSCLCVLVCVRDGSGHKAALAEAGKLATAKGALKAQEVAVSGAFHTSLMSSASDALATVLATVTFQTPRIPVYSNVTAQPFPDDPAAIPPLLQRQLCEPVKWEATVKGMIGKGKTQLHELGPGQQIKAMVKRIDNACWRAFKNVPV